jgi:hypothetical protein
MANLLSQVAVAIYTASRQLISGADVNAISAQLFSAQLLTAHAGGGKAAATQIGAASVLATSATDADSLLLPLGYAGLEVLIANPAGHTVQVFGKGTDTINDIVTATGIVQAASTNAIYKCLTNGPAAKWYRVLTA